MVLTLDQNSRRVLGTLMEKEMTTPELYPLSVNSLLSGCNQKTSRDPVMQVTEDEIYEALNILEGCDLVSVSREGRVARFEHRIRTVLQLRRDETALVCLLLLRGPQTVGELRGRSDRLFTFDDSAQVQSTLNRLASRPEPLTQVLPRAAGSREDRWADRLSATLEPSSGISSAQHTSSPHAGDVLVRLAELERRVAELERAAAERQQQR